MSQVTPVSTARIDVPRFPDIGSGDRMEAGPDRAWNALGSSKSQA